MRHFYCALKCSSNKFKGAGYCISVGRMTSMLMHVSEAIVHLNTNVCLYVRAYISVCMCLCIYMCLCIFVYVYVWTRIYVCICACMYVYTL